MAATQTVIKTKDLVINNNTYTNGLIYTNEVSTGGTKGSIVFSSVYVKTLIDSDAVKANLNQDEVNRNQDVINILNYSNFNYNNKKYIDISSFKNIEHCRDFGQFFDVKETDTQYIVNTNDKEILFSNYICSRRNYFVNNKLIADGKISITTSRFSEHAQEYYSEEYLKELDGFQELFYNSNNQRKTLNTLNFNQKLYYKYLDIHQYISIDILDQYNSVVINTVSKDDVTMHINSVSNWVDTFYVNLTIDNTKSFEDLKVLMQEANVTDSKGNTYNCTNKENITISKGKSGSVKLVFPLLPDDIEKRVDIKIIIDDLDSEYEFLNIEFK